MLKNWQDFISKEIKQLIDIEAAAKSYSQKIQKKRADGFPQNAAIRSAASDTLKIMLERGIKNHDAVHFLHFCGLALHPEIYSGCGCHDYLKNNLN